MCYSKAGVSILQWHTFHDEEEYSGDYALYITFTVNADCEWSCPVRVDKNLLRKSLSVQTENSSVPFVITSHEYKGQTFLFLHHDSHPQMLIENHCGVKIFCAQIESNENSTLIADCQHLNWLCGVGLFSNCYYTMPSISEKFPDISPGDYPDKIVLSTDPERMLLFLKNILFFYTSIVVDTKGCPWSSPVNITNFNEQFVCVPYYGEIKVTVIDAVKTILVIIDSVSQVEISARDIRVRLTMRDTNSSVLLDNEGQMVTLAHRSTKN